MLRSFQRPRLTETVEDDSSVEIPRYGPYGDEKSAMSPMSDADSVELFTMKPPADPEASGEESAETTRSPKATQTAQATQPTRELPPAVLYGLFVEPFSSSDLWNLWREVTAGIFNTSL